jgi:PPE-repeat protein
MAAAAAQYVGWLNAAAEQAAEAAAQALTLASAFEAAQNASVLPAAVSANRVQLMSLIATNLLGQNTPAIAQTEFEYLEMWAADVAAMAGYHGEAMSAASALPSFSAPPVSLTGLEGLASSSVSWPAGLVPVSELAGLASEVQTAVAAVPSAVSSASSLSSALPLSSLTSLAQVGTLPASLLISPLTSLAQGANSASLAGSTAATGAAGDVPKFVGSAVPEMKGLGGAAGGLGSVGADLGHARLVGAMSVPATWEGSVPGKMISSALSGLGGAQNAAATAEATGPTAGGMPMMPMPMGGGMGGGAPGGPLGRGGASPHVVQSRPSVVPRTGIG